MFNAVIGDIAVGTCVCAIVPFPAVGVVAAGDPSNLIQGSPAARTGDIVIWPCGVSNIVSTTINNLSAGPTEAKTGDSVVGCGNGIMVNPTHNSMMGS